MIYVLAGIVIAALAVIAYLVYALVKSGKSERASMGAEVIANREQLKSERNKDEAERQRDAAIVKATAAQAAADRAIADLAVTEAALKAATARLTERVKQEVHGATPAQVAAIVADLLSTPVLPAKEPT
jgi:FtsZ-interacting cell division protein ZipA